MSQLDQILNLFSPEGPPKPTPAAIAKIRAMDEAVHGTRQELEEVLSGLEEKNRRRWYLGDERS